MASNPTKAELAGDFGRRLQELDTEFKTFRALAGHRIGELEGTVGEQEKTIADLQLQNASQKERLKAVEKYSDHPAALSTHDQRLKALEKGTDRTWQFAAMAISVVVSLAFVKK